MYLFTHSIPATVSTEKNDSHLGMILIFRDIEHCLEIFWVVKTMGCYWHSVGSG